MDAEEFLILADTTPTLIESGRVAMNVPCDAVDSEDTPGTDIAVVAGVALDVSPVDLDYVEGLTNPDDNKCAFHASFPEEDEDITDVAIINNGSETINFTSGNFATISLTTAKTHGNDDVEDDDEVEADDAEDEGASDEDKGEDDSGREFRAELNGGNEEPSVDTDASGEFEMELESEDEDIAEYDLVVQDINVTAAHIHMGSEGENGDIVVTLDSADLNEDGGYVEGTFDSDDLEGLLEGQEMADLVELIEDGEAYVNVHTDQNPDGEIRGQLEEE